MYVHPIATQSFKTRVVGRIRVGFTISVSKQQIALLAMPHSLKTNAVAYRRGMPASRNSSSVEASLDRMVTAAGNRPDVRPGRYVNEIV